MECRFNLIGFNKTENFETKAVRRSTGLQTIAEEAFDSIKEANSQIYCRLYSKIREIKHYQEDPDNNNSNRLLIQAIKDLIASLKTKEDRDFFQVQVLRALIEKPTLLKVAENMADAVTDSSKRGAAQRDVLKAYLNFGMLESSGDLFLHIQDPDQKRFATADLINEHIEKGRLENAETLINSMKDTLSDASDSMCDYIKIHAQEDLLEAYLKIKKLKKAEYLANSIQDQQKSGFAQLKVLNAYLDENMLKEAEDFIPFIHAFKKIVAKRLVVDAYLAKKMFKEAEKVASTIEDLNFPEQGFARLIIVEAYLKEGMLKEAETLADAIQSAMQEFDAKEAVVKAYIKLKRVEDAESVAFSIRNRTLDFIAQGYVIEAYLQQNRKDDATRVLNKIEKESHREYLSKKYNLAT